MNTTREYSDKLVDVKYYFHEAKLKEDTFGRGENIYGIYLDAPIHLDLSACRYLIGHAVGKVPVSIRKVSLLLMKEIQKL